MYSSSDLYDTTTANSGSDSQDQDFISILDFFGECPVVANFHQILVTEHFSKNIILRDVIFLSQFSSTIWQPPKSI
jgi:hypothetical protein